MVSVIVWTGIWFLIGYMVLSEEPQPRGEKKDEVR